VGSVTGAALYAHQGGWDEMLFVLAPLVLFAVLLLVARRRVDHMENDGVDDSIDDEVRGPQLP
jgi:predicted MFS family arabinose efflux permease